MSRRQRLEPSRQLLMHSGRLSPDCARQLRPTADLPPHERPKRMPRCGRGPAPGQGRGLGEAHEMESQTRDQASPVFETRLVRSGSTRSCRKKSPAPQRDTGASALGARTLAGRLIRFDHLAVPDAAALGDRAVLLPVAKPLRKPRRRQAVVPRSFVLASEVSPSGRPKHKVRQNFGAGHLPPVYLGILRKLRG
jgi:hypothetical protein